MADPNTNSNGFLYFLVGAMLVGILGFGVYYFTQDNSAKADLEISVGEDGIKVDGN
jgi:LPXTG-motif cell wall-anchored protein